MYTESKRLSPLHKVAKIIRFLQFSKFARIFVCFHSKTYVRLTFSHLLQPKLLQPVLLKPAERLVMGGLRVFLLNDGRVSNITYGEFTGNLLPAEGAIFLTNYRVVFKGQPCDPFSKFFN